VALSAAGALALLLVVNSYATCRNNQWAQGCLWRDAEALISVGNVESLSIVTAAFLYILEGQKRKQRDNLEAYDLLKTCNESGVPWLMGRIQALESLNGAGLPLDGQELAGLDLHNLQAPHGHWHQANLENSVLRNANLAASDFTGANLRGADLRGANLRNATLCNANLRNANLEGANLEGALLDGADFEGADLTGTNLPKFSTLAANR
jgi:uncharacterized protein YjbI with pentapeptide repeats